MTNTELIQAIRAEIERLKGICKAQIKANPGQAFPFVMEMTGYDKIRFFLDTIEKSEEPMNQDILIEEVKRYYSENFAYISSDQPTISILTNIARHFAEFGAASKCKGCNNAKGCVTCINGDQWAHYEESVKPTPADRDVFKELGTTEKEYLAKSMDKVHLELEISTYLKDWEDDEEIGLHLSTDNGRIQIELEDVRDLARHFARWGAEHLKK